MERPANVATPPDAVVAPLPPSEPEPGLWSMDSPICVALSLVSMLPSASSTATVTAGDTTEPATVAVGSCTNANCAGGPGVMSKGADGSSMAGELVAARLYPAPALFTDSPENVASPPWA